MKLLKPAHVAWLGVGVLLGGGIRMAASKDAPDGDNPNVVVLRNEKRVSLEKDDTDLEDIARAFAAQSGYTITVDETFREKDTPYHVLFSNVPLTRALYAVGYLAGGKWERTRTGYALKPVPPEEAGADLARYEAALQKALNYLANVDPKDPALNDRQQAALQSVFDESRRRREEFGPFPLETMGAWKVTGRDNGLSISYSLGSDESADGKNHWRGQTWKWFQ